MSNQNKAAIARVSRDRSKAILQTEGGFYVFSLRENKRASELESSLAPLVASGEWRRPTSDEEREYLLENDTEHDSIAPVAISEKEAKQILDEELGEGDLERPENDSSLFGDELYEFNDEYDFYAVPFGDNPEEVSDVYALDPVDEATLYHWDAGEFLDATEEEFDSSEMNRWVLIDKDTAQYIARWRDHTEDDYCLIHGNDPGEKSLFEAAEAEIDWDFIRTLASIVADASGYSPAERSRNATKQRRGPGGRFARTPGKSPVTKTKEDTSASSIIRTYLPGNFTSELVSNPTAFIADFAKNAPASDGPSIGGGAGAGGGGGLAAAGDIVGKEVQEDTRPSEGEKAGAPSTAYFAVVDPNDNRAVQSLIAITKDEQGVPQAWNRNQGQWKHSPEALADIQSITPPDLVLLEDEGIVETVVQGIDEYDKTAPADAEPIGEFSNGPVVADAYTSADRSRNALKQRRGPDGRFAGNKGSVEVEVSKRNNYFVKTYLPANEVHTRIDQPNTYIGKFLEGAEPVSIRTEKKDKRYGTASVDEFSTEGTTDDLGPNAMYLAVVGENDTSEVYYLIAFTKNEDGGATGWYREGSTWVESSDVLSDYEDDSMPPVVELSYEEANDVKNEVDKFDSAAGDKANEASVEDIQRGYARYDGTFNIKSLNDVYNAVLTCSDNAPDEVKVHIAKRAKAFNRMDIVPEQWRTLSYVSQTALYGNYGEVIVAAGNGRGGNEETLKQYWSNGKGAAKIRWGTEGDLTRCHRHLTKYIGSQDAWGYCQNLHQRKFGKSNYRRDNG